MEMNETSLIQAYTSLGQSVDKIAAFPGVRRDFLDRLAIGEDDGEAVWRLLQLRKAGRLPKHTMKRN
jgi:hypothetical protein